MSHKLPGPIFERGQDWDQNQSSNFISLIPHRIPAYSLEMPQLLSPLEVSKFYLCIYSKNKFKFKFTLHIGQICQESPGISLLLLIIAVLPHPPFPQFLKLGFIESTIFFPLKQIPGEFLCYMSSSLMNLSKTSKE